MQKIKLNPYEDVKVCKRRVPKNYFFGQIRLNDKKIIYMANPDDAFYTLDGKKILFEKILYFDMDLQKWLTLEYRKGSKYLGIFNFIQSTLSAHILEKYGVLDAIQNLSHINYTKDDMAKICPKVKESLMHSEFKMIPDLAKYRMTDRLAFRGFTDESHWSYMKGSMLANCMR